MPRAGVRIPINHDKREDAPHEAANQIGLTHVDSYDDMINTSTLTAQLTAAGVSVDRIDLPNIVGMGGTASVISYISPKTGLPVSVLVIPHQYDIDRSAEDYFYFVGVGASTAATLDWTALYDRCVELTR